MKMAETGRVRIELVDGAGGAGGGLAPPDPTCSRVRPLLPRGAALDVAPRLGGALVGYASRVELLTAWASWRVAAIWRGNAGWWRVGASAASRPYILRRSRGSAPSVVRWSVAGALAARNTMYSIVSPNSIANRNIGAGAGTSAGSGFSVALDEAVTASSA